MKRTVKIALRTVLVLGLAVTATGCFDEGTAETAAKVDSKTSGEILAHFQKAQPAPKFTQSQLRDTLISIQAAQAQVVQTTTFSFNAGVQDPFDSCPSIGYPIASTTQITSPDQVINNGSAGSTTVAQIDPNGVFSGDSSGSYVLCVAPNGEAYVDYWEGDFKTKPGAAKWNDTTNRIELIGTPSFTVDLQKK